MTDQKNTNRYLTPIEIGGLIDVIALEAEREKLRRKHLPIIRAKLAEFQDKMAANKLHPRQIIEFRDLDRIGLPPIYATITKPEFIATAKQLVAAAGCNKTALQVIPLKFKVIQAVMAEAGTANLLLEQARERLVQSHADLVYSVARKNSKWIGEKMELADIVQEGMIGLHDATVLFRPNRGANFLTYARWYVDGYIKRAYQDKGGLVRLPSHKMEDIRKFRTAQRKIGYAAGDQALAVETGLQLKTVKGIREILALQTISSLDAPLATDDEESSTLLETLPDENAVSAEEYVMDQQKREFLGALLHNLNPKQDQILRLRYGLGGCRPHTLEEVGDRYCLTRERIRQIQNEALRNLRRCAKQQNISSGMV